MADPITVNLFDQDLDNFELPNFEHLEIDQSLECPDPDDGIKRFIDRLIQDSHIKRISFTIYHSFEYTYLKRLIRDKKSLHKFILTSDSCYAAYSNPMSYSFLTHTFNASCIQELDISALDTGDIYLIQELLLTNTTLRKLCFDPMNWKKFPSLLAQNNTLRRLKIYLRYKYFVKLADQLIEVINHKRYDKVSFYFSSTHVTNFKEKVLQLLTCAVRHLTLRNDTLTVDEILPFLRRNRFIHLFRQKSDARPDNGQITSSMEIVQIQKRNAEGWSPVNHILYDFEFRTWIELLHCFFTFHLDVIPNELRFLILNLL